MAARCGCSPDGIRTHATALRGRRPRPLDDGAELDYRVGQFTDPVDAHGDGLAGEQRAHAGRCTGENHITGQQGHDVRDVRHQGRRIEHHLAGAAQLTDLLVDLTPHFEIPYVEV